MVGFKENWKDYGGIMKEPQVLWKVLIGEYWNNMEMKKSSLVKIKSFVIDIENNLWLPRRYVNNIFF